MAEVESVLGELGWTCVIRLLVALLLARAMLYVGGTCLGGLDGLLLIVGNRYCLYG
jgi:hypothetical protein